MKWRIQKILAHAGIASRRDCEKLIAEGRVQVNGKTVLLGESADPDHDVIAVDKKRIHLERKAYYVLNKPKGYVVTLEDEYGRMTIMDLVQVPERVFPVGRLDKDSEGILLLTNDGDLAHKVLHPSYHVEKEYEIILNKPLDPRDKSRLEKGIPLDGRRVAIKIKGSSRKLSVIIHEGRKHVLRRLFQRIGYVVKSLRRVRIGNLTLHHLAKGAYRRLTTPELEHLRRLLERER